MVDELGYFDEHRALFPANNWHHPNSLQTAAVRVSNPRLSGHRNQIQHFCWIFWHKSDPMVLLARKKSNGHPSSISTGDVLIQYIGTLFYLSSTTSPLKLTEPRHC